jgi:hypothetical protein
VRGPRIFVPEEVDYLRDLDRYFRLGCAIALLLLASYTQHRDPTDDPALEEGVEEQNQQ